MKYFVYLIFIFLLFSLNIGVFSFFQIHGVIPNLLLFLVVLFALEKCINTTGLKVIQLLFAWQIIHGQKIRYF